MKVVNLVRAVPARRDLLSEPRPILSEPRP